MSDLIADDPDCKIAAILARADPDFIERVLRRDRSRAGEILLRARAHTIAAPKGAPRGARFI